MRGILNKKDDEGVDETKIPIQQPKIKSAAPMLMPGQIPGSFTVAIFGLGEDNLMYMYDGADRRWVYN